MSANNFILINRETLEVSLRDMDTNALLGKISRAKTLDKAIDLSQRFQEKNIVEYGISFVGGGK